MTTENAHVPRDVQAQIHELAENHLAHREHMESAIEYAAAAKELKHRAAVLLGGTVAFCIVLVLGAVLAIGGMG